jgi:hypothetical protein
MRDALQTILAAQGKSDRSSQDHVRGDALVHPGAGIAVAIPHPILHILSSCLGRSQALSIHS